MSQSNTSNSNLTEKRRVLPNSYRDPRKNCNNSSKKVKFDREDDVFMDVFEDEINNLKINSQKDLFEDVNDKAIVIKSDLNEYRIDSCIKECIELTKRFYEIMKNDSAFGVNKNSFIYWKKTPGTGKKFREYINSCTLLKKLVQAVNERKELSKVCKKIYAVENLGEKQRLLGDSFNLTKDILDFRGDKDFFEFKRKCHFKRYMYIYHYFLKICKFSISNIKEYDDIIKYYKEDLGEFEYKTLKIDTNDELVYDKSKLMELEVKVFSSNEIDLQLRLNK